MRPWERDRLAHVAEEFCNERDFSVVIGFGQDGSPCVMTEQFHVAIELGRLVL